MFELLNLPESVQISEITPRDGLQNIGNVIPTEKKMKLIKLLKDAGCKYIELTSFVNPKWVPQMQDAAEITRQFTRDKDVSWCVLVPNKKGLERAIEAGAKEVVAVLSASETHNKNNVNKTVEESLAELSGLVNTANDGGVRLRANIATAFGCEFEGKISPDKVIYIAKTLEDAGYEGITLCDTTGMADPKLTYDLCSRVISSLTAAKAAVHFHKRNGIEYANVLSALLSGIRIFEAASGGLGGCPFAPGASGNMNTEYLVEMFEKMGVKTGINLEGIKKTAEFAREIQNEYAEKPCNDSIK